MSRNLLTKTCFALLVVALTGTDPVWPSENDGLQLPEGFTATVVHEGVGPARHVAVRQNGDIYVITQPSGSGRSGQGQNDGILALRDTDRDGSFDEVRSFSTIQGTGIEFHDDMLYVSDSVTVYRFNFDGDELVPASQPEIVVQGFAQERQHADKPFAFDGKGNMYVNVGAPSNSCQQQDRTPGSPGMRPCPLLDKYGGIWRFDADRPGQTQAADGVRFASGLRNSNALEWNRNVDRLYVVMHGRDQMDFLFPELFNAEDNARRVAEEMFMIEEGREYGWPYTLYDAIENQRILAPEYGGDGQKTPEDGLYPDPVAAFPAHWAPNDLVFYDGEQFPDAYKGGAFIAFHGSWNRAPLPQAGYNVTFVPFGSDGLPSDDWTVFADGFSRGEVASPSDARARPVGLAVGPDGSLYVTDSQKGRIWRISYTSS